MEGGDNLEKPTFAEAEGLTRLVETTEMSVGHYSGVPKPVTSHMVPQSSFSHSSGHSYGPSPNWYTHIKPEETWYSAVLPRMRTSAAHAPAEDDAVAEAEVIATGNGLEGQKREIQEDMREQMEVKEDPDVVKEGPSKDLTTVSQQMAPAFDENVFDQMYTTLRTNRPSELLQTEHRNRLMAEEAQVSLASQKKRKWRKGAGHLQKECTYCHTQFTPEWRRGPSGNRDLCNSCGLLQAKMETDLRQQEAKGPAVKDSRASEEIDMIDYRDDGIHDIPHAEEKFENVIPLLEPDEPSTSPPQQETPHLSSDQIPNTERESAPDSRPIIKASPAHSHYRHTPPPRKTEEDKDLQFAASLAAGMQASGFDPGAEMSVTYDDDDDDDEGGVEDTMDEAEAERVVRDLLGKYTTLFA